MQKEEVINNVIATVYGSVEPGELSGGCHCPSDHHHKLIISTSLDKLVLVGNHRDAWVFGAADPNSGTAVLMEIARGLGQLRKQGEEERKRRRRRSEEVVTDSQPVLYC